MNNLMSRLIEENTPKINRLIADSLAAAYMPLTEKYIDTVFKSASKSFPKGLEYVGYQRCTPTEEFNEITRPKNNKRTFDLAHSDLYLVKYFFKFNDIELPPRYIYLPFVNDGGIIFLGGSCFHLSPVLTDKVISPSMNSIFVRLLRDKVNFERCYHSIIVDGMRDTVQVVWSRIYRRSQEIKKMPTTTKANTTVVHYLLAKYGFSGMFTKYAGFIPVIGGMEIAESSYPKEHWVICESTQVKPKTVLGQFYEPTIIRLAIPRERWDPFVQSLVAGFYYVVDHFPSRIKTTYVDSEKLWMILLGHIIFSGVFGEGKLFQDINEHFNSLDEYADNIVVMKLREIGYEINDFYDLLVLILRNFNEWIVNAEENSVSLYGKTMEVLYYILFDITAAIFRTNFKLNKLATKKILTPKEIVETMNKQLKMGAIFGLTRANIAVSSVSYSGDNKYPKITSVVAQQQGSSGATRGRKTRTVVDASKRLDASMAEVGSILFLSKSNPTPAVRANMYMDIDLATGAIIPNPKFAKEIAEVKAMLKNQFLDQADTLINSTPA